MLAWANNFTWKPLCCMITSILKLSFASSYERCIRGSQCGCTFFFFPIYFFGHCRRSNRKWWWRQPVLCATSESKDALESMWEVPQCGRNTPPATIGSVPAAEAHGDGGHWLLLGTLDFRCYFWEDGGRAEKLLSLFGTRYLTHPPPQM